MNMNTKKRYAVTVSACATVMVVANNEAEAEEMVLNDFQQAKESLIFSIDHNGYEAEVDDGLTEELDEDYEDLDE